MTARALFRCFLWMILLVAESLFTSIAVQADTILIAESTATDQSPSDSIKYLEIIVGASLLIILGMMVWALSLKKKVSATSEALEQELSAKRKMKKDLQLQNDLTREVSALADIGGWQYDYASSKLVWSPVVYKIYEVADDFIPDIKNATSFFAPEVQEQVKAEFRQGVADGSGWDIELPVVTAKGNRKWVRSRGKCEMKDGEVVKVYGAVQDISLHKKNELDMQRQKDLLEQIGALAIVGGWEIDLRTNEHRWSKNIYKIHERPKDFNPNVETAIELYAPEARDTIRAVYNQALVDGKGWDIEVPLLTVKGNRKWVRSHAQCEMADGKVVRLYGLTQDITRYHDVENQLKQNQEELSNRILDMEFARQQVEKQAEELVALAEEQNSLRAKAEIGEKSKAEFLAIMSHEIRTPMTGIIGMTDLLLAENLTQEQQKKAQTIKNSSELLLTILNDILDQSKLDSGKFELSNIDIRLTDLIQDTLALMTDKAESKGLSLDYHPTGDLPAGINIDSMRLQQILINLMSNAIKFTEAGEIGLNVMQDTTAEGGKILRFEVIDQGIGISEDQLSRLFQRFEQADASTARKYGGSGLGLSICRQLIDLMGGDIGVKSELGKGSCFWFTVPLHEVGVEQLADDVYESSVAQDLSLHILLAEDNAVNQTLISTMLEAAGHTMEIVDNGQKAVEAVLGGNFDLVLMDVRMPVMEGPEATRRIRASGHKNAAIPIVALTADAMKETIPQFLEAGMNAVETKPIQLPKLLKTIETVVTASGGHAANDILAEPPVVISSAVEIGDTAKMIELNKLLDSDAMDSLIDDAAQSIASSIADIKTGIIDGNNDDVLRFTHTIRGMCASLGAVRLVEEASFIEENIDDLDQIQAFLPNFEATAEQTIEWWNQFIPAKQKNIA